MSEIITLAIVACIIIALVTIGYCIGLACSWWDRQRQVKQYRIQRKG